MLDRLKSLPLTIMLTVLIWMYAEAQFTSLRDVRLDVEVVTNSPRYELWVHDPGTRTDSRQMNLAVTIQGPQTQLEQIARDASRQLTRLTYQPSEEETAAAAATGNYDLNTLPMLNRLDYFRGKGVTVTSASPSRVQLLVDPVTHFEKQPEFRHPLVERVSITPEKVAVAVPSRALQSMGGQENLRVVGVITDSQVNIDTLPPDSEHVVNVTFVAEYGDSRDTRILIKPDQGRMTFRVRRQQQAAFSLPAVPIRLSGSPEVLERYRVEIEPRVTSLTVAGSATVIDSLRTRVDSGGVRASGVVAVLDITADDVPTPGFLRRRLRYTLPDGLTLITAPAEANFRLIDRIPPAPPTPATPAPSTAPAGNG